MKHVQAVVLRLAALLAALCLAGCGAAAPAGPVSGANAPAQEYVTFTDALGRQVSAPRSPQRVAALIGSFADIWCLAGGAEQLVATANDAWTSFDLPLRADTVNLGSSKEISLELLVASEPDLILASSNTGADVALLEPLTEMGLTVAYFQVSTFEEYLDMLDLCTQITGCTENYEAYGAAVAEQVKKARARADGSRPRVLYIRASSTSYRVKNSENSVLGEMLQALDCENVADSDTSLLEALSMEAILLADPDYIFVVYQAADPTDAMALLESTLLSDPAWQTLTAVQSGRYHVLDQSLYNLKPNARWGEAYERLADILYPADK